MNDKQVIDILMNIIMGNFHDNAVFVAELVNSGIPTNVIAEYIGKSETAEYLQRARERDLI